MAKKPIALYNSLPAALKPKIAIKQIRNIKSYFDRSQNNGFQGNYLPRALGNITVAQIRDWANLHSDANDPHTPYIVHSYYHMPELERPEFRIFVSTQALLTMAKENMNHLHMDGKLVCTKLRRIFIKLAPIPSNRIWCQ